LRAACLEKKGDVTKGKADNLATRYPRYTSTSSKAFFSQGSKPVPPLKKKLAQAITALEPKLFGV
jgi:hypothetical protein